MKIQVAETVVLTLVVLGFALPVASASPVIAYSAWLALWLSLVVHAEAIKAAVDHAPSKGVSIFPALPAVFVLQHVLDRVVPVLGSAVVLFGGLALITSVVRNSAFPSARVVR